MASLPFDVAIVGGGPGGAATALSLLAHAPSLSVVLIEASRYDACRIGEALPPPARSILEHLAVWEKFSALNPRGVFRTRALWGEANPIDNDFIFMPANTGWHVDRTLFDAMLATAAEERGARLFRGTLLRTIDWADGKWQLRLSSGATLSAPFVVDATGGKAVIARRLGARLLELDRLVGLARFFENDETDPSLMVEACEDGWWYTAGLPGGKRVAGCITDADLAHRRKLGETEQWQRSLASAPAISSILRQCEPCSPVVARSTASHRLDPAATERWLAVGDAATRFDPLSSQGVTKALRSGIFASYAIGDWLVREDSGGLRRYQQYLADEFKSYSEVRVKYYRQEQRWPASDFWRRRHEAGRAYNTELVGAAAG